MLRLLGLEKKRREEEEKQQIERNVNEMKKTTKVLPVNVIENN